jgi:uncharacterized membrane protein SirB2
MLAPHFLEVRAIHVGCVALSGSLFTLRGVLRLNGVALANHIALRVASIIIDSVLLTAAILLTVILRQYPFLNDWLTVKLLLLVVYVALGSMALSRAKTGMGQIAAFGGALLAFIAIIGVAITRQPLGWLTLLH